MTNPTHSTPASDPDVFLVMGGQFNVVRKTLFDSVRQHLRDRIAVLPAGEIGTAEALLGVKFWVAMPIGARIKAGLCVSHIATEKILPLHRITIPGKASNYYEIR